MIKFINRRKRNNSGLTLVEVLITAAILVGAISGILLLFIYCYHLVRVTGDMTVAMSEAQDRMEEIRNYAFADIPSWDGTTFTINQIKGSSLGSISVDSSTNPDLLEVEIKVSIETANNFIIGEDRNFDGFDVFTEDSNGNGVYDTPISIVSLIAER